MLHSQLLIGRNRDAWTIACLIAALSLAFLAYISRLHGVTHDLFHEMALYREALVQNAFPQNDVFAFTPTVSPSVHHEWGTGAILYWVSVSSGLGGAGLMAFKFAMTAMIGLICYRVARMRGANPIVFAIVSLVVFPMLWVGFATVRAQLITLLAIAIQMWMIQVDYRGSKWWVVPWFAMYVIWLNCHAGFVVGVGMLVIHTLERAWFAWRSDRTIAAVWNNTWHLVALGVCIPFGLLINPYGWKYIPYLVSAITLPRPTIAEWRPLWHTYNADVTMVAFFASIILLVAASRNRKSHRLHGLLFTALCAYMTLKHIRHGSIYAVVWIAYVPAWISHISLGHNLIRFIDQNRQLARRFAISVSIVCGTFAVSQAFWNPTLPSTPQESAGYLPLGVVDYLRDHQFRGNAITPFSAGAYVSWKSYPDIRVSLDGRYEVAYQPGVMESHDRFYDAEEDWQTAVTPYNPDVIIIPTESPVRQHIGDLGDVIDLPTRDVQPTPQNNDESSQTWQVVYIDDAYLILSKPDAELPLVDRRGQKLLGTYP